MKLEDLIELEYPAIKKALAETSDRHTLLTELMSLVEQANQEGQESAYLDRD